MAETGTRPEIEDVLSSIRRLVSQDTRPAVSAQALTAGADTLVLTPAQLVLHDAPPVDVMKAQNPVAAQKAHGSPTGEIAQPEVARSAPMSAPQDWEPDFDDSAAPNWPTADSLVAQDSAAESGLGDELTRLEDTIARLEAEVSLSEAEFEPETGDPFAADGMAPLADLPESYDEADLQAGETAIARTDTPDIEALESDKGDFASVTEVAIETDASFAERANDPSDIDPDLHHGDWAESALEDPDWPDPDLSPAIAADGSELREAITAPRRLHLGDAAEVRCEGPHRASTYESTRVEIALEDEPPERTYMDGNDEEGTLIDVSLPINEDALHALVSDLIRKELQGAMGARITRNLRKLVRREVQRALVSRDLD